MAVLTFRARTSRLLRFPLLLVRRGQTFQVSDVVVNDQRLRRLITLH